MAAETLINIPEHWGDPSWVSPASSRRGRKAGNVRRSPSKEHMQMLADWETNAVQEEVKSRFARFSSVTGLVEEASFHKVIGVVDKKHTDLLYDTLMREQPGNSPGLRIDYILTRLLEWNSPATQLSLIFSMCDTQGSGEIGKQELEKFLEWSVRINKLKLSKEEVTQMAAVIFDSCKPQEKDTVAMEDFLTLHRLSDQLGITHTLKFPMGTAPDFEKAIAAKRLKSLEKGMRNFSGSPQQSAPSSPVGGNPSPLLTAPSTTSSTDRVNSGSDSPPFHLPSSASDPTLSTLSRGSMMDIFGKPNLMASPICTAHPDLSENKEFRNPFLRRAAGSARHIKYLSAKYWLDILIILLWALATSALFVWRFLQYMRQPDFKVLGYGICTTKAAAETLKFNMALILLPVCSRTVTLLRTHLLGFAPGVDRLLHFHKMVAGSIVLALFVHVGGHLIWNFRIISDPTKAADVIKYVDWSLCNGKQATYFQLFKLPTGISGLTMLLTMLIAFPFALRRTRSFIASLLPDRLKKFASFNTFWITHQLLLLNYVLIIWHGTRHTWNKYPTTSSWYFIVGPVMLYAWERLMHLYSGHIRLRQVEVTKAVIHPGNVLALHMVRPPGFQYKSGMYVYLHCPAISKYERHPFTMTSCPFDDEIMVHIKKAGDWTAALHDLFAKSLDLSSKENTIHVHYPDGRQITHVLKAIELHPSSVYGASTPRPRAGSTGSAESGEQPSTPKSLKLGSRLFPKILLDGPYGAPSQEYRRYKVLMLIGAGIGITPFASITSDLLTRIQIKQLHPYRNDKESSQEPAQAVATETKGTLDRSASMQHFAKAVRKGEDMRAFNTQKVYVIWTTRDQSSLTWFRDRMDKLSAFDHKGVIELHQYLTWVSQDARSAMLKLGQSLSHRQSGIDPITGMRTKVATHFGRPSWEAIFDKVAGEHPKETVGIFFCGPEGMAVDISAMAQRYSTAHGSKTWFDFRKEMF